jgi:hypothetical protein
METTMSSCIRCGDVQTPDGEGYCTSCLREARAEVFSGMRRLGEYLAAQAAFDEWLRARGAGPAAAT